MGADAINRVPTNCNGEGEAISMKYDPEKHHRRSIRLRGYNYSKPGTYFVTICTHEKRKLFGDIINGEMHLNESGKVAQWIWNAIPQYYPGIKLDQYVVMPNHLHGILINTGDKNHVKLSQSGGNKRIDPMQLLPMPMSGPAPTLGQIIRRFKALTTYYIHAGGIDEFAWQERFHDEVVLDASALEHIRRYIINNPARWIDDDLHIV